MVKGKPIGSRKAVWVAAAVAAAIVGYLVWKHHRGQGGGMPAEVGNASQDTIGQLPSGGGYSGGASGGSLPAGGTTTPPPAAGGHQDLPDGQGTDAGIIQLVRENLKKGPHKKTAVAASQDAPGAQSVAANSGYGLTDESLLAPASRLHDAQTQAGSLIGSGVTLTNPDGYGPPGGGVDIGPSGLPVGFNGQTGGTFSQTPVQRPPRFVNQGA